MPHLGPAVVVQAAEVQVTLLLKVAKAALAM
jgi:hypothetical protein